MKRISTLFLRSVIVVAGGLVLALFTYLAPQLFHPDTGGYRWILGMIYICLIPFFIVLFHAMKLLSYIDKNRVFSEESIKSLIPIKYGGAAISVIVSVSMPYVFIVADRDDAPGVVLIGLIIIALAAIVAAAAEVLRNLVQNAVDLKAENDLTV